MLESDVVREHEARLIALGMSAALIEQVQAAGCARQLIVVTGTPGSGLTTTVRTIETAIPGSTIVDPLEGPDAMQIALAILRNGPVIAAVPGTDAIGTIRKLRAMRVDRSRLAEILGLVIAQRLARRLCEVCRRPVQAQGSASALLGFDPGTVVFMPGGCAACADSGIVGAIGVFEYVVVDSAIAQLIRGSGDGVMMARHAYLNAPNMGSAARALVRDGVISADEGARLSRTTAPAIARPSGQSHIRG